MANIGQHERKTRVEPEPRPEPARTDPMPEPAPVLPPVRRELTWRDEVHRD
jgi:hypothetical protein